MAEARIPIFCVAKLSGEKINRFFDEANEATHRHEFDEPMGFLILSNTIPEHVEKTTTKSPVDEIDLQNNPFTGKPTGEIITWAQNHLKHSGLSTDNLVILDERTAQDNTCLLVSEKEMPDDESDKWLMVRSDFESSIISLMTKETGVGGDDQLDTEYDGSDGVLRNRIKNRE